MAHIETIIDSLYENDKEFKDAYDVLQQKLVNSGLGFGMDTIIDRADIPNLEQEQEDLKGIENIFEDN